MGGGNKSLLTFFVVPPPTPTEILNTPLWIQIDMVGPGSEPLLATGFTFCEED